MTAAVGSMVPTSGALSLSDDSRDGSITADPLSSGRPQTSDLKVLLSVLGRREERETSPPVLRSTGRACRVRWPDTSMTSSLPTKLSLKRRPEWSMQSVRAT